MLRALTVGVVCSLAACRPPPLRYVGVRGSEITAHLEELRAAGEAEMPTVVVVPGKRMEPAPVEILFLYQTVRVGKKTTSIEALAAGCGPGTETDPAACALARYRDTAIRLRDIPRDVRTKEAKPGNGPAIISAGLALGAFGAMVYCIAQCESNRGIKSLGLGFGSLALGIFSYLMSGGTIRD